MHAFLETASLTLKVLVSVNQTDKDPEFSAYILD
jgi:hypothetical protein